MSELIERLAKEAGIGELIDFTPEHGSCRPFLEIEPEQLAYFAALVAEECARIAENTYEGGSSNSENGDSGYDFNGDNSAEAIRATFPPLDEADDQE